MRLLALLLLPSLALAAPFDGPRVFHDHAGAARLLHAVPGAVTVTWAPGVQASGGAEVDGPAELLVGPHRLQRIGRLGPDRFHTERYAIAGEARPEAVAKALLQRPDVVVAAPLYSLTPGSDALWRAATPHLLLQLAGPQHADELARVAERLGVELVGPRGLAPDQWLLAVPPGAPVDPVEAAMALQEWSGTRWAQVDWLEPRVERYVPADPRVGDQWHLENTGQSGGTPANDVRAFEAFDLELGDPDVIVAIMDSGVDHAHPEYAGTLLPGYDFVDGDDDANPTGSTHGTRVAGVAAAPENGEGIVGTCPGCTILPIRVIGASNAGEADAHDFATANGAWVINNSWGPPDGTGQDAPIPPVVATAIDNAVTNGRDGKGVAIFWAAGNGHPVDDCGLDGYVSYPSTLGIGASGNTGFKSSFSELCPALDLSSPSAGGTRGLTSTTVYDPGNPSSGYTDSFGGTSGASPVAAGVGALVLSALPDLTWDALRELLRTTATKIDPEGGDYDANGHSLSYGYGRVDAMAALEGEIAFLSASPGTATCETALTIELQAPTDPGLGSLDVAASSSREGDFVIALSEGADGVYTGTLQLTAGPPSEPGLSVAEDDQVTIVSDRVESPRVVAVDCAAPDILTVSFDGLSPWTARVFWTTTEPATSTLRWGDDVETPSDGGLGLEHQVFLLDLVPCTNYALDVFAEDMAGNRAEALDAATILTPGDVTAVPPDAPDDADPCDPDTWVAGDDDDATGDDDDDATPPDGGLGGEGDGCQSGCSNDCGGGDGCSGSGTLFLLAVPLGLWRRRERHRSNGSTNLS
jgi:hypothetical protein